MTLHYEQPRPGWRTWGSNNSRCAHCCNGDRCDDPTHYDRNSKPGCPHCLNTGYALWNEAGRAEKAEDDRRREPFQQYRGENTAKADGA